jgi:hypothetical protein
MRNTTPVNHFPPTLFSRNRSPIYGEAHLFSQPALRLVTVNPSLHGQCPRAILVSDVDRPGELAAQGAGGVGIIAQVAQPDEFAAAGCERVSTVSSNTSAPAAAAIGYVRI